MVISVESKFYCLNYSLIRKSNIRNNICTYIKCSNIVINYVIHLKNTHVSSLTDWIVLKGGKIQIGLSKVSTQNGPQYVLKLIFACDTDVNQISVKWQYDVSWRTNNRKINCKMTDTCDFQARGPPGRFVGTRLGKTPASGTTIQIGLIIKSWVVKKKPVLFRYPIEAHDFPNYYYDPYDEYYG